MSSLELFRAVRDAIGGYYDVVGELGETEPNGVYYLAREVGSSHLVALRLAKLGPNAHGGSEYALDATRELDASVPDVESECPRCHHRIRRWARLCTQCGMDVSGVSPSASSVRTSRESLLSAVRVAAGDQFDVLGDMPRKEAGGLVYFAREIETGRVVALRLSEEAGGAYAVGVTRVLRPLPVRATTPRTPQRTLTPVRGSTRPGPVSISPASVERLVSALPQANADAAATVVPAFAASPTPRSSSTGEHPAIRRRRVVLGIVVLVFVLIAFAALVR